MSGKVVIIAPRMAGRNLHAIKKAREEMLKLKKRNAKLLEALEKVAYDDTLEPDEAVEVAHQAVLVTIREARDGEK